MELQQQSHSEYMPLNKVESTSSRKFGAVISCLMCFTHHNLLDYTFIFYVQHALLDGMYLLLVHLATTGCDMILRPVGDQLSAQRSLIFHSE